MTPILFYREVDSTNNLALNGAKEDATHGACWVADAQTEGRGRRELGGDRRQWFSPGGSSVYMSVLLRPRLETAKAAGLTLAAGIGVCAAIKHELPDLDVWLKWPNDIFIGTRKLGGILTEAVTGADGSLEAVVAGVGLNVNLPQDQVPGELIDVMTSIRIETGRNFDRLSVLHPLRDGIVAWCDAYAHKGFSALAPGLQRYDRSHGLGVLINDHGERSTGVARGIDDQGRLNVELEDGSIKALSTGEVILAV